MAGVADERDGAEVRYPGTPLLRERAARIVRTPPWWSAALLTALLVVVLWPHIAALGREGRDLQQDWVAARRLGGEVGLYEPVQPDEAATLGTSHGISVNAHPPTAAVLAAPLRVVGFPVAAAAWSGVSLAAFATALWLATRQLGHPAWFWFGVLAAWWFPLVLHVRFGQWSTAILLGNVVLWVALERRRALPGGVALAVLGAIKVLPAGVAIVLVRRRRWSTLGWAAAVGLTLAASLAVLAPTSVADFLQTSSRTEGAFGSAFGNGSILGVATRTFEGSGWIEPVVAAGPGATAVARWAGVTAVVVLTLWGLVRSERAGLQVGLVSVAMLLVSPVTWRHSDVLLVLPAVVIVGNRLPHRRIALLLLTIAGLASLVDHWRFMLAQRPTGEVEPLSWVVQLRSPGALILVLVFTACVVSCHQPRPWARTAAGALQPGGPGSGGWMSRRARGRSSIHVLR